MGLRYICKFTDQQFNVECYKAQGEAIVSVFSSVCEQCNELIFTELPAYLMFAPGHTVYEMKDRVITH